MLSIITPAVTPPSLKNKGSQNWQHHSPKCVTSFMNKSFFRFHNSSEEKQSSVLQPGNLFKKGLVFFFGEKSSHVLCQGRLQRW
jgi:hypothetical protein